MSIRYCHFVLHNKWPLVKAISHCSPETFIVGMLLAAALLNFSIALKQDRVWGFGLFFVVVVVVADLVCGSWGFFWF